MTKNIQKLLAKNAAGGSASATVVSGGFHKRKASMTMRAFGAGGSTGGPQASVGKLHGATAAPALQQPAGTTAAAAAKRKTARTVDTSTAAGSARSASSLAGIALPGTEQDPPLSPSSAVLAPSPVVGRRASMTRRMSLGELVAQLIETGATTGVPPAAVGLTEEKASLDASLFDGSSADPNSLPTDEAASAAPGPHESGLPEGDSAPKPAGLSWANTRERITKQKGHLQAGGREVSQTPLLKRAQEMDEKEVGQLLGQVVSATPMAIPTSHLRRRSDVQVDAIQAASLALLQGEGASLEDAPPVVEPPTPSGRYISHSYLRPARVLTTLRRTDIGTWETADGLDEKSRHPAGKRDASPPNRTRARAAHGFTGKPKDESTTSAEYKFKAPLSTRARDDAAIAAVDPISGSAPSAGATVIMPISMGYGRRKAGKTAKFKEEDALPDGSQGAPAAGSDTDHADLASGGDSEFEPTSDIESSPRSPRGRSRVRPPALEPFVSHNNSSLHPLEEALSIVGSFHGRGQSKSPQRKAPKKVQARSKKPFEQIRARLVAMDSAAATAAAAEAAKKESDEKDPAATNLLLTENPSDPIWKEVAATAATVASAGGPALGSPHPDELDSDGDAPDHFTSTLPTFHRKSHPHRGHRAREYSIHARTGVSLLGSLVDQSRTNKTASAATDKPGSLVRQSSWVAATAERTEALVLLSPRTKASTTRELQKSASAVSGEAHQSVYAPIPINTFLPSSAAVPARGSALAEEKQDSATVTTAKLPPVPSLPLDTSVGLFPSSRSARGPLAPNSSGASFPIGSQTARLPGEHIARVRQPVVGGSPTHLAGGLSSNPPLTSVPPLRPLLAFTPAPLLPTPPATPAPGEWTGGSLLFGGHSSWMAATAAAASGSTSTYARPIQPGRTTKHQSFSVSTGPPPRVSEGKFAHRAPSPIETTPRYTFALPKRAPIL